MRSLLPSLALLFLFTTILPSPLGAQSALIWQRYMDMYNRREEELFVVPSNSRRHAMMNPNAVFQKPLSFEDWYDAAVDRVSSLAGPRPV